MAMSDLDKAMRRYMEYLVHEEDRSFSYRDFMRFEVDGIEHKMTHQTFRNKISQLRRDGIIELSYNCGTAYYSLKDKKFGKPMTPTHTGGQSCHQHPIAKIIRDLPFDKAALHNIRMLFTVRGCWNLLAESQNPVYELQSYSRDIRLPTVADGPLRLRPVVHMTDNISVDIGCSGAPVVADICGMIRLSKALGRLEEMLFRLLEASCCGKGSAAMVVIPDSSSWTVTMWHFGRDSVNTYKGKQFEATWEIGQNELLRVYSKGFPGTVRGRSKTKLRVEMQQYPRSTVEQIMGSLCTNSSSVLDWIGGGDR